MTLAAVDVGDARPDRDGAGLRMHGDLDFLTLLEAERLHDFHGQRDGQRAAGLDNRPLHARRSYQKYVSDKYYRRLRLVVNRITWYKRVFARPWRALFAEYST